MTSPPTTSVHTPGLTSIPPLAAGPRLLQSIALGNFLSFGPEMPRLPLGNLNVLIGPNGSGKSNLLEAISLLRSCVHTPASTAREGNDLRSVIARGGGIGEWVWKGEPHGNATLEAIFTDAGVSQPLRHVLAFRAEKQHFRIEDERIENEVSQNEQQAPHFYYHYRKGRPVVNTRQGEKRKLPGDTIDVIGNSKITG